MYVAQDWQDYEVIDTGGGEKLERWGDVILRRPIRRSYGRLNVKMDSGAVCTDTIIATRRAADNGT